MISAAARTSLRYSLTGAAILVAVVLMFGGTVNHGFIALDDAAYLTQNWHVQQGLTADTCRWAWTTNAASNWHPLTWLVHAANWQMFGTWAGGHHLVSVVLHAFNAILVWVVVQQCVRRSGPGADDGATPHLVAVAVALLFAVHPTRAESIAWAAELKDVLCGLGWWLSLAAYLRYGWGGDWRWYAAAWLGLAGALLAKPMAVTLPAVFLLCDYWPLRRWGTSDVPREPASSAWSTLRLGGFSLLLEKLPFTLLVAVSAGMTLWAQRTGGAMVAVSELSLELRVIQAIHAYGEYLQVTFWPSKLAIYYPLDRARLAAEGLWNLNTVGCLAVLVATTAAAWWQRRQRPWLWFGWLWFMGTLVPVIGLVKVGDQSHADRYLYLPQVGLWWALVTSCGELSQRSRLARQTITGLLVAVVGVMGVLAFHQVRTWKDTGTVARQALWAVPGNYVAHTLLGIAANDRLPSARGEQAEAQFARAIELEPGYYFARLQLARALYERGAFTEAEENFRRVARERPQFAPALAGLGAVLVRQDRLQEAADSLGQAATLEPTDGQLAVNHAQVLRAMGRHPESAEEFLRAAFLDPALRMARIDAGEQLLAAGDAQAAEDAAIRGWSDLNRARAIEGSAASSTADLAVEESRIFGLLAQACQAQGQREQAIGWWERALALHPQDSRVANNLAWLLATTAGRPAFLRQRALQLAQQANQIAPAPSASLLDTLAVAQAASGKFADAAATAERAIELADAAGDAATADEIRQRLALYQRGEPYVEP